MKVFRALDKSKDMIVFSYNSSLVLKAVFHLSPSLMIVTTKIYIGEGGSSWIQQVILSRNEKLVFDDDFIHNLIVNVHMLRAIFLGHNQGWNSTRASALMH